MSFKSLNISIITKSLKCDMCFDAVCNKLQNMSLKIAT